MVKIRINFTEATEHATALEKSCEELDTLGNTDDPDLTDKFSCSGYFDDLRSKVTKLTEDGTKNVEAVNKYVEGLKKIVNEPINIEAPSGGGVRGVSGAGNNWSSGVGPASSSASLNPNTADEDNIKREEVLDKAKKMKEQGSMSGKSFDLTGDVINGAASMALTGTLTLTGRDKTIGTTEHAMKALETKKMSDGTYYDTLDVFDRGLKMVKSKKLSNSSYSKTADVMDNAITALEKGKIDEKTYKKVLDTLDDALEKTEKGKMSDSDYRKTSDTVDNCTNKVNSGKMKGDSYKQSVDTVNDAVNSYGSGKMDDNNYRQTLSTVDTATDLLGDGKLDAGTYDNMVGTVNDAIGDLNNGKVSSDTYKGTMNGYNYAMSRYNSGKVSFDDCKNAVTSINQAYADFKSGKIDEATYNTRLQEIQNVLNGQGQTTSPPVTSPQPSVTTQPSTIETSAPKQPDSSKTVEGTSIAGALSGGVVTSEGANSLIGVSNNGIASSANKILGSETSTVVGQSASELVSSVLPFSNVSPGNTGAVKSNNASAGIIAAASLLAGGAAAGGGIFIGKKLSVVRFGPEDWMDLDDEYRKVISSQMKKVGFKDEEIDTFANSKFKISTRELNEHISKIEKAIEYNPACAEDLLNLYKFSMFDDNSKVVDYLLFIVMIIDGYNAVDDYNMYNIINQSIDDIDDADFIYSGISMDNYFDDGPDDDEVMIMNNPIDSSDTELEEALPPSTGKEWLKDMGVDAY